MAWEIFRINRACQFAPVSRTTILRNNAVFQLHLSTFSFIVQTQLSNKLTLETSAFAVGTHNLKVALISSARKSLINITADQQRERLDLKAYQTMWF